MRSSHPNGTIKPSQGAITNVSGRGKGINSPKSMLTSLISFLPPIDKMPASSPAKPMY